MTGQVMAIGIIILALGLLTRDKKPAPQRIERRRQRFNMAKTSQIIRNKQNIQLESTPVVNVAGDHIQFIESLVYAENA